MSKKDDLYCVILLILINKNTSIIEECNKIDK